MRAGFEGRFEGGGIHSRSAGLVRPDHPARSRPRRYLRHSRRHRPHVKKNPLAEMYIRHKSSAATAKGIKPMSTHTQTGSPVGSMASTGPLPASISAVLFILACAAARPKPQV